MLPHLHTCSSPSAKFPDGEQGDEPLVSCRHVSLLQEAAACSTIAHNTVAPLQATQLYVRMSHHHMCISLQVCKQTYLQHAKQWAAVDRFHLDTEGLEVLKVLQT